MKYIISRVNGSESMVVFDTENLSERSISMEELKANASEFANITGKCNINPRLDKCVPMMVETDKFTLVSSSASDLGLRTILYANGGILDMETRWGEGGIQHCYINGTELDFSFDTEGECAFLGLKDVSIEDDKVGLIFLPLDNTYYYFSVVTDISRNTFTYEIFEESAGVKCISAQEELKECSKEQFNSLVEKLSI